MQENTENSIKKCGFVAILGATNVGKSTLINRLVGSKVSIVSHKVQTTRNRVLGVHVSDLDQIVFIDTPGIFNPSIRLERAMVNSAWGSAKESDINLLLVDGSREKIADNVKKIINKLGRENRHKDLYLVLNKVDKIRREKLLRLSFEYNELYEFKQTFMISALTGSGVDGLLDGLKRVIPVGEWHYPLDITSNLSERLFASEVIREKLFEHVHQELPYSLMVDCDEWSENSKSIKIRQTIYVLRDSHKKMIIGKGAERIKRIGMLARTELSSIFAKDVNLFLSVRVRKNWQDDPEYYSNLGLDFN